MDKFFIRKVSAVWAFDKYGEAVWKCSDVSHFRISQDGESSRKRDSSGAMVFRLDTNKSASVSFDVAQWDFNIISAISGSEMRKLDGTDNPYDVEPICIPYAQSFTLTDRDIALGYVRLAEKPRLNSSHYYEISVHKLSNEDTIEKVYQQSINNDDDHFSIIDEEFLILPTSLSEGDIVEALYEYNAYKGIEIINSALSVPQTWKVRFLLLVSPVCRTNEIISIWITANNATPDLATELNFDLEENIPIRLELGCRTCDEKKRLYEIVLAGNASDGSDGVELRTHDEDAISTHDRQILRTIQ